MSESALEIILWGTQVALLIGIFRSQSWRSQDLRDILWIAERALDRNEEWEARYNEALKATQDKKEVPN